MVLLSDRSLSSGANNVSHHSDKYFQGLYRPVEDYMRHSGRGRRPITTNNHARRE